MQFPCLPQWVPFWRFMLGTEENLRVLAIENHIQCVDRLTFVIFDVPETFVIVHGHSVFTEDPLWIVSWRYESVIRPSCLCAGRFRKSLK